jgi:uncharacterized OB-fold protein
MAQQRPKRVAGGPHDEFWAWCGKGELRLQRCGACGKLSWPVVGACEYCKSPDLAWEQMSGRGRIVSWCTFDQNYYGDLLPTPYDAILVELDEGPLFISNPQGFTEADIEMGMPVRLDVIDCEDVAGPFRLPVFARG